MYLPKSFELNNPNLVKRVLNEFSFGTLVTHGAQGLQASHLPFELDESGQILRCHMARANPQWREFDGKTEVLAIFQGPHGYVSPRWYQSELAVPTWNYVAVHVQGVPRLVEDDSEVAALLESLIARYEAGFEVPWKLEAPEDWQGNLRRAIVGFELPIARIEAKAKLSQNRSREDIEGVLTGVGEGELRDWMREIHG